MTLGLGMIALVVPDYDAAIGFFVGQLGFSLRCDIAESETKRWIEVEGRGGMRLLLAKATSDSQAAAIGNQTGGRVGFFLYTDDIDHDHARMKRNGVIFHEEPREETYGRVAVFEDHVGNRWDLIEAAKQESRA